MNVAPKKSGGGNKQQNYLKYMPHNHIAVTGLVNASTKWAACQGLSFAVVDKAVWRFVGLHDRSENISVPSSSNYVHREVAISQMGHGVCREMTIFDMVNWVPHFNFRIHHKEEALTVIRNIPLRSPFSFIFGAYNYFVGGVLDVYGRRLSDILAIYDETKRESPIASQAEKWQIEKLWIRNYPRPLFNTEVLYYLIQSLSRKLGLPSREVSGINLFLPVLEGDDGVPNNCDSDSYFKCAFKYRPSPFWLALAGLCIYSYGYISANIGHGNAWPNLLFFIIGLPMLVRGIFEILDTVRNVRHLGF